MLFIRAHPRFTTFSKRDYLTISGYKLHNVDGTQLIVPTFRQLDLGKQRNLMDNALLELNHFIPIDPNSVCQGMAKWEAKCAAKKAAKAAEVCPPPTVHEASRGPPPPRRASIVNATPQVPAATVHEASRGPPPPRRASTVNATSQVPAPTVYEAARGPPPPRPDSVVNAIPQVPSPITAATASVATELTISNVYGLDPIQPGTFPADVVPKPGLFAGYYVGVDQFNCDVGFDVTLVLLGVVPHMRVNTIHIHGLELTGYHPAEGSVSLTGGMFTGLNNRGVRIFLRMDLECQFGPLST